LSYATNEEADKCFIRVDINIQYFRTLKLITILLPLLTLGSLFSRCNENSEKVTGDSSSISQIEKLADATDEQSEYCFRNEMPVPWDKNIVEIEELKFTVAGDAVKGTFKWVPAEKGGLSGEISGTKKGNAIEAVYNETYAEEPFPIALKILLFPDQVVVTSSDEFFGNYTIKKSDCK